MKFFIRHALLVASLLLAVLIAIAWAVDAGHFRIRLIGYRWHTREDGLYKVDFPSLEWSPNTAALDWTTWTATTADASQRMERANQNQPFGWDRYLDDGGLCSIWPDVRLSDVQCRHEHSIRASIALDAWRVKAPMAVLFVVFIAWPLGIAARWIWRWSRSRGANRSEGFAVIERPPQNPPLRARR